MLWYREEREMSRARYFVEMLTFSKAARRWPTLRVSLGYCSCQSIQFEVSSRLIAAKTGRVVVMEGYMGHGGLWRRGSTMTVER